MKVNNLIIGGGISGLTLANYITDYLIVEKIHLLVDTQELTT